MNINDAAFLLGNLVEDLAEIEHSRWAHWQRYVHSKGLLRPDGSITLPADLVDRWEKQMTTPYSDLTDEEKESDREQVRLYIPVIASAIAKAELDQQ